MNDDEQLRNEKIILDNFAKIYEVRGLDEFIYIFRWLDGVYLENKAKEKGLEERLAHHPELRAKIEAMLDVVENKSGEWDRADDVEEQLIEELRKMGQDVYHGWAKKRKEKIFWCR